MNQVLGQLVSDGWDTVTDDGFVGLVGPFFKKTDAAGLCFGFPTFDKHRNRNGLVQGGALVTFADRAFGIAVREATGAQTTATVQLNVMFMASVEIGQFVETRPVVERATRQIVFMNANMTVGSRAVAAVQGVWKILVPK